MLVLTAEREACPVKIIGPVESEAAASQLIEDMEAAGTWPEGYDAALEDLESGQRWYYTDTWCWAEV